MARGLKGSWTFNVTGTAKMRRTVNALAGAANDDLERAVRAHAEDVMADSQENHVPVMDNHLRSSAYVKSGRDGRGVFAHLGYSAAHARRTHENPRAGKTGGVSPSGRKYKKWAKVGAYKFLERPFRAAQSRLLSTVAEVIRMAWQRKIASGG